MKIIEEVIDIEELRSMTKGPFGNMVKAVVDVDREIIALPGDMHADLEQFLLENGSEQVSVWGINLYPDESDEDFVEFDSMINVRPMHENLSRGVDNPVIRQKILEIVRKRVRK